MNTILLAYRNRPQHLRLFLQAIGDNDAPERHKIVVVDQSSDTDPQTIIDDTRPRIATQLLRLDDAGSFWKCKLLNMGLRAADTEFVTVADVDCLGTPNLLDKVSDFFAIPVNSRIKLGYRVRWLDRHTSRVITEQGLDHFRRQVVTRPDHFGNIAYESYAGVQTGNSQMTIRRDILIEAGGFDERFRGYGFEDHEVNLRLHRLVGDTPIFDGGCYYHQWHPTESRDGDADQEAALQLFDERKAAGFPVHRTPCPSNSLYEL